MLGIENSNIIFTSKVEQGLAILGVAFLVVALSGGYFRYISFPGAVTAGGMGAGLVSIALYNRHCRGMRVGEPKIEEPVSVARAHVLLEIESHVFEKEGEEIVLRKKGSSTEIWRCDVQEAFQEYYVGDPRLLRCVVQEGLLGVLIDSCPGGFLDFPVYKIEDGRQVHDYSIDRFKSNELPKIRILPDRIYYNFQGNVLIRLKNGQEYSIERVRDFDVRGRYFVREESSVQLFIYSMHSPRPRVEVFEGQVITTVNFVSSDEVRVGFEDGSYQTVNIS